MTLTAPPLSEQYAPVSYFSQDRTIASEEELENGGLLIRGLKVFRTGTFRDSKGRKNTWTTEHLDSMVQNFTTLRSNGVFADVPVRVDHGISARDVCGYFAGVYRQGDFLLADLEITEPDAAARWKRKTFRGRSLEVGPYVTNEDQIFYPCATGLAFVDIGAIEHLHRIPENKEPTPVTENTPQLATFRVSGVPTTDVDAVQAHITALEEAAKNPPAPHTFRVAGEDISDYAKVQSQLDTYSAMFTQMSETTRTDFVKKLADDSKIAATGIDAELEFVKTLDEAQFAAYRKRWEAAPAANLFNKQPGNNGRGAPAPTDTGTGETTQVETDLGVVSQFRRAGQGDDFIKNLPSYKRLVSAGKAPF